MTPDEYINLYEKYLKGECSVEEEKLLLTYQDDFKLIDKEMLQERQDFSVHDRVFEKIQDSLVFEKKSSKKLNLRWVSIAAMFILIASATFLIMQDGDKQDLNQSSITVKPGTNKASLTLADGSVITLDDVKTGHITAEGITTIRKLKDGELAYHVDGPSSVSGVNSLSTPKGGTYNVILPDGTKVRLNAASTLTYPTAFQGSERRVKLQGEAYFEVAENRNQPFYVEAMDTETKVLGTHFNICAYSEDETVKTTLVEGSVQFMNASSSINLIPGQQGISSDSKAIRIKRINVNNETSWKNGYFNFDNTNIKDVMKQIARWYDIEVKYQGDVNDITFGGSFSLQKDFLELLKGLEQTGLVTFKIDGRRITVMK